ncbi:MAG TPA: hypothetical protein VH054_24645 [Polyangiaceae bacterium]|jgi:hypothetical protein|nr:hypothetical protein [Polyangiaceae bacterium]
MPKKKVSKSKATKAKSAAKPATVSSPSVVLATRALSSLPALKAAARDAFRAQTRAQERADLGGQTKSAGVLREAGAWIPTMAAALDRFGAAIAYSKTRFAFYCESVLALSDAIAHATTTRSGSVTANARRDGALARAHEVRKDLRHALGDVTRGSDSAKRLATIDQRGQQDDVIASVLGQLADLADDVLASAKKDDGVAALVDGVLSAELVVEARDVAGDLTSAGAGRFTAGPARVQDPPEVNLAEGTVLAEMRVVKNAFERAHEKNASIPHLVPGPETRKVLASHAKGKVQPPALPPAQPSPPTNGA